MRHYFVIEWIPGACHLVGPPSDPRTDGKVMDTGDTERIKQRAAELNAALGDKRELQSPGDAPHGKWDE